MSIYDVEDQYRLVKKATKELLKEQSLPRINKVMQHAQLLLDEAESLKLFLPKQEELGEEQFANSRDNGQKAAQHQETATSSCADSHLTPSELHQKIDERNKSIRVFRTYQFQTQMLLYAAHQARHDFSALAEELQTSTGIAWVPLAMLSDVFARSALIEETGLYPIDALQSKYSMCQDPSATTAWQRIVAHAKKRLIVFLLRFATRLYGK